MKASVSERFSGNLEIKLSQELDQSDRQLKNLPYLTQILHLIKQKSNPRSFNQGITVSN
jgi:hypothetical protein